MGEQVERLTVAVGADTSALSSGLGGIAPLISKLGGLITNPMVAIPAVIAVAGIAIGKFAMDAQKDIGTGTRAIRTGTGETGKSLDSLVGSMKTVGKGVPESFSVIGGSIAQLHSRLGLTGPPLEKMATQMLNLSRVGKVDIKEMTDTASAAFNAWSIPTGKQSAALDTLYKVSEQTGVNVLSLTDQVRAAAPITQQLGMSFEQTASLIGQCNKEGIDGTKVMAGFKMGIANMAKAGKDPVTEFPKVIAAIKGARTETEAINIANATFGKRMGTTLVGPIRQGKLNFDQLTKSIAASHETVNKAAEANLTFGQRLKILGNNAKIILQPLGRGIFTALNLMVKGLTAAVQWIGNLIEKIRHGDGVFKTIRTVIITVFEAVRGAIERACRFIISIWNQVVIFCKRNWETIKTILMVVWTAIKIAAVVIWNVLKVFFIALWETLKVIFKVNVFVIRDIILPIFRFIVATGKVIWNALTIYFRVMKEAWHLIWTTIKVAFQTVWTIIVALFHAIWEPFKAALTVWWDAVKLAWKLAWDLIRAAIHLAWSLIKGAWDAVMKPLIAVVHIAWDAISGIWSGIWGGIKDAVKGVWDLVVSAYNLTVGAVVAAAKAAWDGLCKAWSDTWNGIKDTIKGIWDLIVRAYNDTIGKIPGLHIGKSGGGAITGVASGGGVGFAAGGMGTDTVPAMLTPGEWVINRDAVNTIGQKNMAKINQGILPGNTYILNNPVFPGITRAAEADAMIARSVNKMTSNAAHKRRVIP